MRHLSGGPELYMGMRPGPGSLWDCKNRRKEHFLMCADQNPNTEHGDEQRVSVLATRPCKTRKPQCVSLAALSGFKMELAGKNGKKGCTDGLGGGVV